MFTVSRFMLRSVLTGLLSLGLGASQAAPTLLVTNGVLMGADNVIVNGTAYDVRFVDGTCAALFNGCNDAGDFLFSTTAAARAASLALLSDVLIDGTGGRFDSVPGQTAGCTGSQCSVMTPYLVGRRSTVKLSTAVNTARRDQAGGTSTRASNSTARNTRSTFAVWSLHQSPTLGGPLPKPLSDPPSSTPTGTPPGTPTGTPPDTPPGTTGTTGGTPPDTNGGTPGGTPDGTPTGNPPGPDADPPKPPPPDLPQDPFADLPPPQLPDTEDDPPPDGPPTARPFQPQGVVDIVSFDAPIPGTADRVPEPGSLALLAGVLPLIGLVRRRRARAS